MGRPKAEPKKCGVPRCVRNARSSGLCSACLAWAKRNKKLREFITRGWATKPGKSTAVAVAAAALAAAMEADSEEDTASVRIDAAHKHKARTRTT